MPNSKQIVYLSQSQYVELIANGTITVDGVTVTYNENDIYVTPQAEPVTDVRVNGTSVASNGVANIPYAELPSGSSAGNFGVVALKAGRGIAQNVNDHSLYLAYPSENQLKRGNETFIPVTTGFQHNATFYGLAKAAGADMKDIASTTVGTYPDEQKAAIQQMLGVSDLIATAENNLVASKAYAVGDVFTANGKLYKVTTAIAAAETIVVQNEGEIVSGHNAEECKVTDYAVHDVQVNGTSILSDGVANIPVANEQNKLGLIAVNTSYGLNVYNNGLIRVWPATLAEIKGGTHQAKPIVPDVQHNSVFYGLAKAAGDTTQALSENAVGTYTDDAKSAIRTMIGAGTPLDVQVDGTSIVSNGIAALSKANATTYGLVKTQSGNTGVYTANDGTLYLATATDAQMKSGSGTYPRAITPGVQNKAVFYGLAQAAGDITMASSSNEVGTYTDSAKAAIKAMLGIQDGSTGTVDVSGTTPTIAAVENTRYVCGEVTSLSFTPPASGISIVRFTSGSTVTVLTIPSTVKFPEWFDPTSLETNTIYEICVTDGIYGAVMSWAL